MNSRIQQTSFALIVGLSACTGAEVMATLDVAPEAVCDVRFSEPASWCGGSPEGAWTFRSACHRPVLEWLTATCPKGSFEMHPGVVRGQLTLTSTSIRSNFAHDLEALVRIDLHEACIQAIGVCPRSHMRELLHWEQQTETECSGYIDIRGDIGHDGGPIHIEGNVLAYDFAPTYSGEFCVEGNYFYLNALRSDEYPERAYYYILER